MKQIPISGPFTAQKPNARQQEPRSCESCGGSITGKRPSARFCSDRCRTKHRRARLEGEIADRITETLALLTKLGALLARLGRRSTGGRSAEHFN
jgi:hypothetical protein